MYTFLNQAVPVYWLVIYAVYAAFVQALPRPDETSGKLYTFFYSFAHALALNVRLAFDPRKLSDLGVVTKLQALQ